MNEKIDWSKMTKVVAYCLFVIIPSVWLPAYVLSLYREELPEDMFALLLLVGVLAGGSISSAPLVKRLKEEQIVNED